MLVNWMPKDTAEALEKLDLSLSVYDVPEIDVLLSKTVLFRGKKFRPILCFLVSQLFRLDLTKIGTYARAAEFVHAATLAHDDVIDESPVRRNRPTLNARSSNARAVLAGDLLLARVMVDLSALGELKIIESLSRTVEELVQGEWLQLEARKIVTVTWQHLETVARKKTGSLMTWCCTTPAHLAKANDEVIRACARLGETMGLVFQMIDDIIDYSVNNEKPFAQDLREGLVNFVTLEMLDHNPSLRSPIEMLITQLSSTEGRDPVWPWKPIELTSACDRIRARSQAKLELADQTLSQLSQLLPDSDPEALQALRSILLYLRERVR